MKESVIYGELSKLNMEMWMRYFGKLRIDQLLIIHPLLINLSLNIDKSRLKFKRSIEVCNLPRLWLNNQGSLSEKAKPLLELLIEIVDINLLWVRIDRQFIV